MLRVTALTQLRRMINGYQVTQSLHVIAVLGIADHLAGGPKSSDEIAELTDVDSAALYRLLRAVAAIGVLEELPARRFSLTELGQGLRSDLPESLNGWAAFVGRPYRMVATTPISGPGSTVVIEGAPA